MKQLIKKRICLLPAIAVLLNACGSDEPLIKHDPATTFSGATFSRAATLPIATLPLNLPLLSTPAISAPITSTSIAYSNVFEKPAELEPAVDFWRKTYGVWHLSQVAFHDNRYLDVIYEVLELPGYVSDGLTYEQKDLIAERRAYWKARLALLESKMLYHAPLNADDQELIAKLEYNGRPLDSTLNGAAERVRAQRGIRERFKRGLEISSRYDQQFRQIFREAGLPEELACLPHVESSFQPAARSSAGAVGMWQFTKGAAKRFMPGGRSDLRLNPIASAHGAANYLHYAYHKLGNWPAAITSYNHGIGGMCRARDQVGDNFVDIVQHYDGPLFGFASRNYYAQFLAALEIVNNPLAYFPEGVEYDIPPASDRYLAKEQTDSTTLQLDEPASYFNDVDHKIDIDSQDLSQQF